MGFNFKKERKKKKKKKKKKPMHTQNDYLVHVFGKIHGNTFASTVEPCYNEVGYNKILSRGNPAGLSSIYLLALLPWYNEEPDTTR